VSKKECLENILDSFRCIIESCTPKEHDECLIMFVRWLKTSGWDIQEDNEGQLLFYTGIYLDGNDEHALEAINVD